MSRVLAHSPLAGAAALFALGAFAAGRAETARRELPALRSELHLPDASILRPSLLGFHVLGADWYWLQAIQYFGTRRNAAEQYRGLAPLMDLVVGLDPKFAYAYRFAGTVLPFNTGRGWVNVEDANRILEKGIRERPDVWQIPFIRGYTAFWFEEDFEKAARFTATAAALKGAPPYLALLATRLMAHTGALDLAMDYALRMAESAEEPRIRDEMRRRYVDLIAERELRRIEAAIDAYQKEKGAPPPSLQALVASGHLAPPPAREPHGGQWIYDPAAGTVRSDKLERRIRLGQFVLRNLEKQRKERQ